MHFGEGLQARESVAQWGFVERQLAMLTDTVEERNICDFERIFCDRGECLTCPAVR